MSSTLDSSESKRQASSSEPVDTTDEERRRVFYTPPDPKGKHQDAGKLKIQEFEMLPTRQMSRRPETSGAIQQHPPPPQPQPRPNPRPQPPLPGQVIFTQAGRVQKQKIPPPVPVRKRKATTTVADTTLTTIVTTTAQNSTVTASAQSSTVTASAQNSTVTAPAQNSAVTTPPQNSMENIPEQNITTEQNPQDIQANNSPAPEQPDDGKKKTEKNDDDKPLPQPSETVKTPEETPKTPPAPTEKHTPTKENPDEQQQEPKEASPTNPTPPKPEQPTNADVTTPIIPPPTVRPRRASACNLNNETLLGPKDTLLIQRRSSSPFQTYSGPAENEFLKSYFADTKNASADTPQGSQSQPDSLNASQKTLNSNASQKSLNPNASQKTLSKTSTDSLTNIKEDDQDDQDEIQTPIVVESIIVSPDSNGKLKRQSSLNDEGTKADDSQINDNDNDVASSSGAGGKISKTRKHRSDTDLIEPAPLGDKKKGRKGRSGRRDSNASSDGLSQTSSPSFLTKALETPLLPNQPRKNLSDIIHTGPKPAVLPKSVSTPAALQTFVKFSGSNMTIHHKIIGGIRRSSTRFSRACNFKILQFVFNISILVGLGVGAFYYFQPPEPEIKYVNQTITNTIALIPPETNPAPGYCFKIVVDFCINHKVPYNYTTYPNLVANLNQDQAEQVGFCVKVVVEQCANRVPYNYTRFPSLFHVNQAGAKQELDMYDAIVDVRCYELAALFLCSVFVPKCGPQGELLYPCRSLCEETKRRCGFFLDVFGLPPLPDYLMECRLLPDSDNPDICVGHREVKEAKIRAARPKCSKNGFQCDHTRCIPIDWRCDGHLDCEDKTDEKNCTKCANGGIHCGKNHCMNKSLICDGIIDCPFGQDERNCIRLHDKMGDVGRGLLQVYDPKLEDWIPACVSHWDNANSANAICALMGYTSANYTRLIIKDTNVEVQGPTTVNISDYQRGSNWVKDFRNCGLHHYPIVNMECQNFECGKKRHPIAFHTTKRIVGGSQSNVGSWPFLAAIHGGPEEIFYCAGVLISDQWVLSASHCVGNATEDSLDGWKIQLGVTRRHSHSYYGQKASVKRVIAHPQYNMGVNHDNDIALFQLERPVSFTEHVLPVCLPPNHVELKPGMRCIVIGWGKSDDDECSEYEPALHEVEVPIISRRLCNDWMIYRELNVTEGMICAGLAEGGKDACQGDSGGPLLCPFDRHKKRWFVGGIVSWGIKCAHPQLPGVYAYVPKYVPWIREMIEMYSDE